jgi:GAF domain-containing protein
MAEDLKIIIGSKEEIYTDLIPQIKALIADEKNVIANLANCAAALKEAFQFWWVGFYLVDENELVLGPFQGPVACTRIAKGKGVCGSSWERNETVIVEDVDQFPGHIACSSASKSEIVVPVRRSGKVVAVLDVDSEHYAHFDGIDALHLEELCTWLGTKF